MEKIMILLLFLVSKLGAQDPLFVGHRGASYLAPENTLASITLAWELGARAAECDIMLTADNQVVLFHDKKGRRLTGHNFEIKNVHFEDIRAYPIVLRETNDSQYAGETIPLLKDVLKTIPENGTLVIEIKTGPEILPFMKDVIDTHWKSGGIAFIAFDFETILAAKNMYPEVPCYYLSAFKADLNSKYKQIAASELDGVNLRYSIIDKKLVAKYRKINKDIWCWTVNDPEDARRMMALGVSAITTDRPAWLAEQVK